jgi:hypothetical protein
LRASHLGSLRKGGPALAGLADSPYHSGVANWVESPETAVRLAEHVLDPARDEPIICVTIPAWASQPLLDVSALEEALDGTVTVWVMPTGDISWEFSYRLPTGLDVYGGAVRLWWPGVDERADRHVHPLFLVYDQKDSPHVIERVVAELRKPQRSDPEVGSEHASVVTKVLPHGAELTLTDGTLDVSEDNHAITITGNWNRTNGTFTHREGTVSFTGSGAQTLSGSNNWYNLTATTTIPRTLTFASNETQTIVDGGTITLEGAEDNLLTLAPSIAETHWLLNVSPTGTTQNISYVDVSYSDASPGATIFATNSNDGGNNINWCFTGTTLCRVSGIVYQFDRTTPLTERTVRVAVNGVDQNTAVSDATTGAYTVENLTMTENDIITAYIEGEAEKGVTVTVAESTANPSDVDIYQDHLSIRHQPGGSFTNANLATAAVSGETDISDIYTVDGSNNLTVQNGKTLFVPEGFTYAPGADINAGGSFIAEGIFTAATHTVIFNGTSAGHDILSGGNDFNNVTVNGTGGEWTLQDNMTVNGEMTLTAGTLDVSDNDHTIIVKENWTNTGGSFVPRDGMVIFNGEGSFTIASGGEAFATVRFNNADGTWTLQDALSAGGDVNIANGTLDVSVSNHGVTVGESWNNTGGTFTAQEGTVTFNGPGEHIIRSNASNF